MRFLVLFLTLLVCGLILAPRAQSSEMDKLTYLTFNQPVQVPGATLSAGTYVVKRAEPGGDPDVIQFLNKDQNQVYATVIAVPTERSFPADKTIITFAESRANGPKSIQRWYYPGEITGEQFVYPKGSSALMASAAPMAAPMTETESRPAPEPAPMAQAPTPAPEPAPQMEEHQQDTTTMAQANPPATEAPSNAQPSNTQPPRNELPKTGSDIPLILLLGGLSLSGGFVLKALSAERS
jgi:LPXTG-motif cell wall-anchored protein